jgi:hypothetical protein
VKLLIAPRNTVDVEDLRLTLLIKCDCSYECHASRYVCEIELINMIICSVFRLPVF